ncbi:MAG: hypothetical protein IJN64_04785 [Lachnospiraceae bacterium]|nr:hypothetical protein [Lachnospiraceae bacterium]
MEIKKLVATIVMLTTIFSVGETAWAAEPKYSQQRESVVAEIAEKYDITEGEILQLNSNIEKAFELADEVEAVSIQDDFIQKMVPVSENLVLVITTKENKTKARATRRKTITSTAELQNILGKTVITLTSVGVFQIDGSTCTPIDAYGTYTSWVWNITTTDSKLGSTSYESWVRNGFSSELNVGVDPVSMTIQTCSYTCKIYCDANGTYSVSWS